jgi:hypothetical protein
MISWDDWRTEIYPILAATPEVGECLGDYCFADTGVGWANEAYLKTRALESAKWLKRYGMDS